MYTYIYIVVYVYIIVVINKTFDFINTNFLGANMQDTVNSSCIWGGGLWVSLVYFLFI